MQRFLVLCNYTRVKTELWVLHSMSAKGSSQILHTWPLRWRLKNKVSEQVAKETASGEYRCHLGPDNKEVDTNSDVMTEWWYHCVGFAPLCSPELTNHISPWKTHMGEMTLSIMCLWKVSISPQNLVKPERFCRLNQTATENWRETKNYKWVFPLSQMCWGWKWCSLKMTNINYYVSGTTPTRAAKMRHHSSVIGTMTVLGKH